MSFAASGIAGQSGTLHRGRYVGSSSFEIFRPSPLVLDLKATAADDNHVIAVFKQRGLWGALSKINHYSLRYRDPVFCSIRELVMSYFNEYFIENGRKTLRSYSLPVDLSCFDRKNWMTSNKDVWYITEYLDQVKHYPVIKPALAKKLRPVDKIEIKALLLEQWPSPKK